LPLSERKLIERITRLASARSAKLPLIRTGIGDDCAVLRPPPGQELLLTTDFSLEGIHFRREWHPPNLVGHRCLARGLSDIAAMGGKPLAAFLSLGLPTDLPQSWVDGFFTGMLALARQFGVALPGGDLAQSPVQGKYPGRVLADIMVVGAVPVGKAVLRSGARPGDRIYLTGSLGAPAAVVSALYAGGKVSGKDRRLMQPSPRVAVGIFLRQRGLAQAMIDVSDGLSTDLSHICESSRVSAEIVSESLPRGTFGGQPVSLEMALHGGEDYQLLFTARPHARIPRSIAGVPVTEIGRIIRATTKRRMFLIHNGRRQVLPVRGWEHFTRGT
jgi:thiamine-monophosphate kinase